MDEMKKKFKIIVAMSGGVDSSVAAALLKKQGFDVVGVFMKFWAPLRGSPRIYADSNADLRGYNRCCSSEAEKRARQVAKKLGIPFYVFNFEKEFKKKVVDYFLKTNKQGKTPNPCVVCNKEIKFGLLLEKALKLDADYVATGHYVRIKRASNTQHPILNTQYPTPNTHLLKSKDKEKDQSYFLWQLSQRQLSRVLFPIGDHTRKEVENLARKFKLPVLKAKKSVEICFIQTTVNDFLKRHLKSKPGKIINKGGKVVGQHEGLCFYTIGQRKGIKLPGGPYYVSDKDVKNNILIVTQNEKDLHKKELVAKDVKWTAGKTPKLPLKVAAKIRYRSQSVSATVHKGYKITFNKPQRAITPGQSIVFYKGEELIGGGTIDNI